MALHFEGRRSEQPRIYWDSCESEPRGDPETVEDGYDANGSIGSSTQQLQSNPAKAYDFSYDGADQLRETIYRTTDPTPVVLKRYGYAYDSAGNRTTEQIDDGAALSTHNNMNRLIGQQPGGALLFKGSLSEASTVTVQGKPAPVTPDNRFEGAAQVPSGTSTVQVQAMDPSGNVRTNTYQVSQTGASKAFTYDANGNLTGDGTKTYEWDAANRLVAVVQGSRRSEFAYDGLGRRTRLTERDGGAITSEQRFLWCEMDLCEERDSSGATVVKSFFDFGFREGSNSFFVTRDHLGSVRQVSDSSGAIRAAYDYDPFGRRSKVTGDKDSPFGLTGHYEHASSGLLLTLYRAYDPDLGRWLSPDPLGLISHELLRATYDSAYGSEPENGLPDPLEAVARAVPGDDDDRALMQPDGPNRYLYVRNDPVANIDPTGEVGAAAAAAARVACRYIWVGVKWGWRWTVQGYKWVKERVNIDGPGGTRIVGFRWKKQPIFRLDYGPIPGSGRKKVLHCHVPFVPGGMDTHCPIYPPGKPR